MQKIIKRDGRQVEFKVDKIIKAVNKAAKDVYGLTGWVYSQSVADKVVSILPYLEGMPTVEQIQDLVELELMKVDGRVAKSYILYREKRTQLRETGWEMTDLQRDILEKKYLFKNESFNEFIKRIGKDNSAIQKMIREKKFLPAGRILMGRGLNEKGIKVSYSNCFVITPPEDNLESIFDTAKKMARTYSYGGGCGTSLEKLRPRGALVRNAAKSTSGAVSFMDLYSLTTGLIGQNSRRGALMLSMPVTHPDIIEFVNVKTDLDKVTKANISVMITDDFMEAVKANKMWEMSFEIPDTGETLKRKTEARGLLKLIATNNWRMAEPGALFWDRVRSYHLNSENPDFEYSSTNPCGEKPLPSGGSCLLGSLNLAQYIKDGSFDFDTFDKEVRIAIAYLDDVLEEGIAYLPLQEQKESVTKYRQLGLGVMGVADALIKLELVYGSPQSIELVHRIGKVMINAALQESAIRAKTMGVYPAYHKDYILASPFLQKVATKETIQLIEQYGLRNAELLSIAPTGLN